MGASGRTAARLCLLLLATAAGPGGAHARPWRVEDLFRLEGFGQAAFDPTGRYLVAERLRPRRDMARFDMVEQGEIGRRAPLLFDLRRRGAPRPLLAPAAHAGDAIGQFSPDGTAITVSRLQGHRLSLGVVALATRRARWFDLTPELWRWGRTLEWLSNDRFVAVVRPPGSLPLDFRMGFEAAQILSHLSAVQARGRAPSVIAIGSGRFRDIRPKAAKDRLVVVDVKQGRVRTLAEGEFFDLEVSPDHRFVALLSTEADLQYPAREPLQVGTPTRRRALTVVDLERGRILHPAPGYDLLSHLLTWSPDGDRLLVYGRRDPLDWASGCLLVVSPEPATAACQAGVDAEVGSEVGGIPVVQADWIGDDPILYGRRTGEPAGPAGWIRLAASGPRPLTAGLPGPQHLLSLQGETLVVEAGGAPWTVDAAGRVRPAAAPGSAPVDLLPPEQGARYAFNGPRRGRPLWLRQTTDAGVSLRPLVVGAGGVLDLQRGDRLRALDPVGARAVVVRRDARGLQTLVLTAAGRPERELMRLNPWAADLQPAEVLPVRHGSAAGGTLTSWLYLPPRRGAEVAATAAGPRGARPSRALPPLMVFAYPGALSDHPPDDQVPGGVATIENAQVLAGAGYAVLVASLPVRPGVADPPAGFGGDILRAVDAAAATGRVDGDRLALWGHSYGGYAALMAATQSQRFRAVIASAAGSDLVTTSSVFPLQFRLNPRDGLWIEPAAGWTETGQAAMGAPPWADPQRYVRDSPIFAADKITAPVLLIGGVSDVFPIEQREEMFSALYRQDKPAVLLSYVGEGHVIYSPANLKDMYQRIFSFLAATLNVPAAAPSGAPAWRTRPEPSPPSPPHAAG